MAHMIYEMHKYGPKDFGALQLRLDFNTLNTLNLTQNLALAAALPPLYKPPPPPPPPSCAAAATARLCRKIVSGQFDEENPFVQILSVLLVQADKGVSFLVVDRIGDLYRNLSRRADVIVTTVGARHKCQQGSHLNIL
ncbi:hypothetical protein F511_28110 [Dorcoceras hygrometricum]|uniref:Uncharacterized protein n=1 Tax=Dorcoceras hygrometricum TaxID=472368 RepID=A0A2Z7C9I8_9LAMI|nr:hypothetical protein F511_28110 [Dorcoceras hygrometricum]